jgi:hypothetical protein
MGKSKATKLIRTVTVIGMGLGEILLFSSCVFLPSGVNTLPNEERYQYINQVKNNLNYESSGKVITKEYDNTQGIVSPSYFYAEIKGKQTFTILSDRLQTLPNVKCNLISDEQSKCSIGQVDITITKVEITEDVVSLQILDSFSGRTPR